MGHVPTTKESTFNLPTSIPIPSFAKAPANVDAPAIASNWLSRFSTALTSNDPAGLQPLFARESWWRDALALSWDLRTLKGIDKIQAFLSDGAKLANTGFTNLKLKEHGSFTPPHQIVFGEGMEFVEAVFTFETRIGRGDGIFRLIYEDNGGQNAGEESKWKAYTVYTALQEFKDHEWAEGARRPRGGNNTIRGAGNWLDAREKEKEFLEGREPVCLIIGAGQAGLTIAARLKSLGVESLIIDRNQRIGDNWRLRYRTLSTHDPVYYCHMAYLPFPSTWPFFTAKDKLADWFESYASIMELNVWTSTTITSSSWDETQHKWTVALNRNGDGKSEQRTFHPHHVILCTGHSGEPSIPSFPGQDKFKGTLYHGSQHKDASLLPDSVAGKKVLIIGTGNSGHDIAQNFALSGASVTMLQRGSTLVVSAAKGLVTMTDAMYGPYAPPVEDADLFVQSFPWPVFFAIKRLETLAIQEQEKEELTGLEKAGFKLNFGADEGGLFEQYITRGGGYYIDVGCSDLIRNGQIQIMQSPDGIKEFEETAVVLADGRQVEADIVVMATGYDNMRGSLRKILGDEVAARCGDVWGLDEEGEISAIWRPSGHPGVWYMGGNLSFCRQYSKYLALQIKAVEVGLNKQTE